MTLEAEKKLVRCERLALIVALPALVITALLAWHTPSAFPAAYRLAVFVWLAPAIGSVIFALIHRLTGGQWAEGIHAYLLAGLQLLPWIWLLALPLLGFTWPHRPALDAFGGSRAAYTRQSAFALRAVFYLIVFFMLGFAARRARRVDGLRYAPQFRWLGPAGLIGLVFILHLLSVDWISSLEPDWSSTGFPLTWMCGQAVAGLSLALVFAIRFGANPDAIGPSGRPFGIDWGNLLLTSVLCWTYVGILQFLIIWAGNLPHEIVWYVHRVSGPWRTLIVLIAIFHFALPFLFLLSRRFKRFPAGLAGMAAVLFIAQIGYNIWLILPSFPRPNLASLLLDLVALLTIGGLFLNRYLAAARRLQSPS